MPKASKSPKRIHSKGYTPTGIRRFFFKLELLGKRRSDLHEYSNLDPVVDTPPEKRQHPDSFSSSPGKENVTTSSSAPLAFPKPTRRAWPQPERVALMNEDCMEDAVIVTTLDDIPFCCHEDLITMSRDKLISVARSLNAKLPAGMAIDIDHVLPTSYIRSSIERIVGLRGDVPLAPKAPRLLTDSERDVRLRAEFDMLAQMNKSPPTSPLARRGQSQGQLSSLVSPRLARLAEEEEEEEDDDDDDIDVDGADRHQKKRKLSSDHVALDVDMGSAQNSPTPLPRRLQRTQSHYMAPSTAPAPARVLRSQSQKLAGTAAVDTAFMYDKLPASRYQRRTRRASGEVKANTASLIPKPIGAPRRTGRLRPVAAQRPAAAPTTTERNRAGSSFSSRMNEGPPTSSTVVGTKRKRRVGQIDAERQMTSGIERMNMSAGADLDAMDMGP